MHRNLTFGKILIGFFALFLPCAAAYGQNCVGIGGSNPNIITQNFDGLGDSPAPQNGDAANITVLNPSGPRRYLGKFDNAVADDAGIVNVPGWAVVEEGTSTSAVTGRYNVGNGSVTGGNTFSFASTGSPLDRALGSLNDDTIATNYLGGCIRNTTGSTLFAVRIAYTGEMWRLGGSGSPDRLDFQYAVNAVNLYNGSYVDFNSLDFQTPDLTGSAGPRDGNISPYRMVFPLTVLTVTLAPNDTLHVRWIDSNIGGADDGLAVDDFDIRLTSPLAADISISGRVIDSAGRGIARTRVSLVAPDGEVRTSLTNPFGYYRFAELSAGETYIVSIRSKRHAFADNSRLINAGDHALDVDFVAEP